MQLRMLDELWTQVGILNGNSASTSDFNWSQEHISVPCSRSVPVLYFYVVMPLIWNKWKCTCKVFHNVLMKF